MWDCRNVDLARDWSGAYIVYQSSEDRGLFYKDYIEDLILALELRGAILVPDFVAFRSHHNKAFQEQIRQRYLPESKISSRVFGCFEDLEKEIGGMFYPCVLKSASGAKSTGVRLCKSEAELRRYARKMSSTLDIVELLKDLIKRVVRPGYTPVSQRKGKFLIQTFLPGLSDDYKVLVYGDKAVAIGRNVPPGDFRASGSGLLVIDEPVPKQIIDYAFDLNQRFGVPYGAYDIAMYEGRPELIEFQFVSFGTTTLFVSNRYFQKSATGIAEIAGTLDLEQVIADALIGYVAALSDRTGKPEAHAI